MLIPFTCFFLLPLASPFRYFGPPPFTHNPRVPPSYFVAKKDTFLTLPDRSYYPPPPPDPPGFTKYGLAGSYHDKAGIANHEIIAALGWKDLLRNQHHHGFYNIEVEDTTERNIHDVYRERYTAKIIPSQVMLDGFESYNVLEMTNYISLDDRGLVYSLEGNSTCISVYNTKALTKWHQQHEKAFKKQFPNSTFPLYILGNFTGNEKFKITPGRIVHREPVSITCCGTLKEKIPLNFHINGRHPCINCYTKMAYIPLRKLLFSRIQEETPHTTESGEWYEIELYTIKEDITTTEKENKKGVWAGWDKKNNITQTQDLATDENNTTEDGTEYTTATLNETDITQYEDQNGEKHVYWPGWDTIYSTTQTQDYTTTDEITTEEGTEYTTEETTTTLNETERIEVINIDKLFLTKYKDN